MHRNKIQSSIYNEFNTGDISDTGAKDSLKLENKRKNYKKEITTKNQETCF